MEYFSRIFSIRLNQTRGDEFIGKVFVPDEVFFRVMFSLIGLTIIIGFIVSTIYIILVRANKSLQSISSFLSCNSCAIGLFYFAFHSFYIYLAFYPIYNYRKNSVFCRLIGYFYSVTCCGISWSHTVLAMNRLCYSLFSNQRWLLTYNFARRLIVVHWCSAFLVPLPLIFFNAYEYQIESRLCILTTHRTIPSAIGVFLFYNVPLTIMCIVYLLIWCHSRQTKKKSFSYRSRDFAIMRHILTLVFINIICGHPYMALIILDYFRLANKESYLLISFFITFSVTANMCAIILFDRKLRQSFPSLWPFEQILASPFFNPTAEEIPMRQPVEHLQVSVWMHEKTTHYCPISSLETERSACWKLFSIEK